MEKHLLKNLLCGRLDWLCLLCVSLLHLNRSKLWTHDKKRHFLFISLFFSNVARPTHLVFSVCSTMGFLVFISIFSHSLYFGASFIRNIVTSLFCIVMHPDERWAETLRRKHSFSYEIIRIVPFRCGIDIETQINLPESPVDWCIPHRRKSNDDLPECRRRSVIRRNNERSFYWMLELFCTVYSFQYWNYWIESRAPTASALHSLIHYF